VIVNWAKPRQTQPGTAAIIEMGSAAAPAETTPSDPPEVTNQGGFLRNVGRMMG